MRLRRYTVAAALAGVVIAGFFTGSAGAADSPGKQWVGKAAPAVRLPDVYGRVVDAGKEYGKRPVVLVFYRGSW